MAEGDENFYATIVDFTTNYNATAPNTSLTSATRAFNRPQRKRFGSKNFKVTRASSNQLCKSITMDLRAEHKLVLSFLPDDRLVIMFKHMDKYVIYRKSDCAVAVLRSPEFKKTSSTVMFDGDEMGAILHNVQVVIMYAVAKKSFHDTKSGIKFNTFDLILVLAKCRGVYLGITAENRVGFFPPEKVVLITRPRACLFPGMTLKVEASITLEARSDEFLSVRRFEVHTITKGKTNLFDWCTPFERRKVPLHVFRECEISGNDYNTSAGEADKNQEDLADDFQPNTPDPEDISGRVSRINVTSNYSDSRAEIERSELFDKIPENDDRLYEFYKRNEDLTEKKVKERERLLQELLLYREVVINDELREIVAESVDFDVLHDLCERIEVSKNRLRDIDDQKETVYEKTYDLLGVWYQKFGSDANLGFLLDALVEVNPEDLNLILKDMIRHLKDAEVKDSVLYHEIPEEDNYHALPKKAQDKKLKAMLNELRPFREVEFNDEMKHIVSQYIDDDVWHVLGRTLHISKNTRTEIKKHKDDIYGQTFDLLGQWHLKFGSDATFGCLLDALESVNPEDLYLILKDLSKMELVTSDEGASLSGYQCVF